jgi:ArsR family transcriptional regulator
MGDAVPEGLDNVAWETLERLYDEPGERVSELVADRPDEADVADAAAVFGALANENRLALLSALREGERCGCELMVVLDAPQSTVATHLRTLRDAGLVRSRRSGRWTYYRIADTAVLELLDLAVALRAD